MNDLNTGRGAGYGVIALLIGAALVAVLSDPEKEEEEPLMDRDVNDAEFVEPDLGPPLDRPHPLRDVAHDVTKVTASVGGLVTALVGWGVLSVAQGDAVSGLLGLIPGLVAAATAAWSAWRTAGTGETHVTPVEDPRKWVFDPQLGRSVLAHLVPAPTRHTRG